MPYLNWKDRQRIQKEVTPLEAGSPGYSEGREKMRLTLRLDRELIEELLPRLREIWLGADGEGSHTPELRLDLPGEWIIFWKKRGDESRLLIAHPQESEWVATVSLTEEHAAASLERLEGLAPGDRLDLGELASTGSVSNLELTWVHLD